MRKRWRGKELERLPLPGEGRGTAGRLHPSEMDKIFSEPNEENDCTERVRKKRLSSILKVPRSPLQDLGSGNEFTQDYHAEKRRKSSRRVSFADTINFRVFKTDVKVNMTEPGNVETARDVRNQVLLNQNEGSETAQCEITGMDTLLHAPIQTSVQQTEQCNADHTSEEMNRHDRTLIFSDENEMDMTASCTAVIMRSNLKRNQETDQPRKIDFTSFMAELASRSEEMAKKFNFFSDPTNDACSSLQQKPDDTTVKKINFNEFLMSVKSSKEVASPTSAVPDKKNLFFVSPQVLEGSIFSPMEDAYNHAQENTCDVTKIFRGQDDGMDVTKCHSSDMKTFFPATCEASSKQLGHEDITVSFRNDGMDMTASHTVKLSFSKNGPSNTENQNQNSSMDFSSNFVSGNSRLEGPPNNQFGVQKGPQTCVGTKTVNDKDEVDFTRSHTICVDKHEVTQISKQGAREMVMMPGSISSGSVFLDNKTVFSTCKDVDVTGNRTDVIYKTRVFTCSDDMEITTLNTVVIDKPVEMASSQVVPKSDKGPGRKSQIGSTGEKTTLFSFGVKNDMEITESCTAAIDRQISSKGQKTPCEPTLRHADKTHVSTCSDDMEITALNTVVIDKPIEKAASQVVPKVGKGAGRRSQIRSTGDETTLFSFGVEREMEITESCTAAIVRQISSKGQKTPCKPTLCHVDKTHVSTCNDDMEITALNSVVIDKPIEKAASQVVPKHDMEITASCTAAIDRQMSSKRQEPPLLHMDKNIEFAFNRDDMQITESRAVPRIVQRVMFKDQLKLDAQVGQEALSNNKTAIFPMGNQDNMEITASHTTAVNNTLKGYENQEVSDESSQQQSLYRKPSSACREKIYSKHTEDFRSDCQLELKDKYGTNFPVSSETNIIKIHNGATDEFVHSEDALDIIQKPQNFTDFPKANSTVYSEDLVKLVKPKDTKSFKLLENQLETSEVKSENEVAKNSPVACSEENGDAVLHVQSPIQQSHLHKDISECLKKNAHSVPNTGKIDLKNDSGKLTSSRQECRLTDLVTDGADAVTISYKDMEENEKMPFERKTLPKDFQTTSEQTEQLSLVTAVPIDQIDPNCVPALSEEMDSNDSLNCDPPDGALSVMDNKEIFPNKRNSHEEQEMCSNQKRAIEQEEKELQNGKKLKRDDGWDGNAPNQQQPTCNTSHTQAETPECEEPPNLSTKSPDRTHSSNSSSLDSIKADADFSSTQPNSQMESQLLTDSICEQNLLEKFQDGVITVREFFTLLQVHIVIQKPRQSHLPANFSINATSAPEDQFFNQYIYRPKLQIYEEDCQLLSQMVNELKLRASDQDKLLVDVNRNLWEVMRTCSDEELKNFGAELNKMKSYFTKKSKVLAHNGKVQLYGKLLQDIQVQWENLHSRMAKVDEFLKEVDNCRLALEASTNLEDYGTENDDQLSEWESRIRNAENELVDLKVQDEVLQRDLSNLEAEKQQVLAEIKHLKKKANDCQELLERYNFTEWEISEWSDHQAVFTFLYDSIELTLKFGPPIDGVLFNEKPCKKTVDVSFESLLDEEKAPLSSRLVKRLIFQFIESQKSWQEKCPTLNHVPQMLHEVSLVVCRCRLLGEEIEFLMKWGGKFNLLKTEVDDTKVKLLFSTSTAFAKFEVTLSLSATYPSAPLPFTVQKLIGNLSQDEISAVVSSVPLGTNYLRRMVKLIHHKLFP
ncbi:protein CASC5 isoform B [Alligator mississippiensis]|uniref:Protein CASC5 isoform B n=1 Tax=Alligator mississippiensis TaxID=8496 RepID=A0A151MV47_ALLMI|nr:protein CASC5 isoform B [Alligator mississippiensis]